MGEEFAEGVRTMDGTMPVRARARGVPLANLVLQPKPMTSCESLDEKRPEVMAEGAAPRLPALVTLPCTGSSAADTVPGFWGTYWVQPTGGVRIVSGPTARTYAELRAPRGDGT